MSTKARLLALFATLGVAVAISVWTSPQGSGPSTSNSAAPQTESKPRRDKSAPQRKEYVDALRSELHDEGVDVDVFEDDGELTLVSESFSTRTARESFVRSTFTARTKQNLCKIGFREVAIKSGIILGESDEYSLGCPETDAEQNARQGRQSAARAAFIERLSKQFATDANRSISVESTPTEIVLTARAASGLSPSDIRELWRAQVTEAAKVQLCAIGFQGLRVKTVSEETDTVVSFHCPKQPR